MWDDRRHTIQALHVTPGGVCFSMFVQQFVRLSLKDFSVLMFPRLKGADVEVQ